MKKKNSDEKNEMDENNFLNNRPLSRKRKIYSLSALDSLALDTILTLYDEKQHLSLFSIIDELCLRIGVFSIDDIVLENGESINLSGLNIPCLSTFATKIQKINLIIHTSIATNTITTIADIERIVWDEFKIPCFRELKLGPFAKFPLIKGYFNLPADKEIRFHITTSHVLTALKDFLKKSPNDSKDIFSFLKYLCRISGIKTLTELGIKIRSYSALIDTIEQIKSYEQKIISNECDKILLNFHESLDSKFNNLKETLESTPLLDIDYSALLVRAISNISIQDFIYNLNEYLQQYSLIFSKNKSVNNCPFSSLSQFIQLLEETLKKPKNNNLLSIPILNSFFTSLSSCPENNLRELLSKVGVIKAIIDTPKNDCHIPKLNHILEKKDVCLNDLILFEKEEKLLEHGISVLKLLSNPEIKSEISILSSKNLPSKIMPEVECLLSKWRGSVPPKWAKFHLLRYFDFYSLNNFNTDNFEQYYTNLSPLYSVNHIIDIDVYFCGYPPYPSNRCILNSTNDLSNIFSHIQDLENIDNLIFFGYSVKSLASSSINQKNLNTSDSNLFVMGLESFYKISEFNPTQLDFDNSVFKLDHNTFLNYIASELFYRSKHWDTSVYFLISNFIKNSFVKSGHQLSVLITFIFDAIKNVDVRLASVLSARILFPALFSIYSNVIYTELWNASLSKNLEVLILKIGILENISELIVDSHFYHYLETLKTIPSYSSIKHKSKIVDILVSQPKSQPIPDISREVSFETTAENNTSPYKLIESIRQEQYGYGINIKDPSAKKLLKLQLNRLKRSLNYLSNELYADKLHFIRELFQNVDDSFKNSNIQTPTIILLLDSNSLTLLSNEPGFKSSDVLALCDIGKSLKREESIGHKGIGFKSVFQISQRPEIHSKNFHFCFDSIKYGTLGYVMPESIEIREIHFDQIPNFNWNTQIYLPFNSTSISLKNTIFSSITETILLFLKHLKLCLVLDVESNCQKKFAKSIDDKIVTLMSNNLPLKYLITHAENNVNINPQLNLAFKLPDNNENNFNPSREYLFCYLPLNTRGFKFAINGPFDLTASRENLCLLSNKNLQLFQQISTLFINSISYLKDYYGLNNMCWFSKIISYLPQPHDFYEPPLDIISSYVLSSLKTYPFVPCLNNKISSPINSIFIPSYFKDIFNLSSEKFLLTTKMFYEIMNLNIVSLDFESLSFTQNVHVIKALRITYFSFEKLIEVVVKWFYSDFSSSLLNDRCIGIILGLLADGLNQNLFVCSSKYILSSLSSLQIFRTWKSFKSPTTSDFYFSLNEHFSCPNILCQHFDILSHDIMLTALNFCSKNSFYDLLILLGFKEFDPYLLYKIFIESFNFNTNENINDHLLFLSFLSNLWKDNPSKIDLKFLLNKIYLMTSYNKFVPSTLRLYIPSTELTEFLNQTNQSCDFIHKSYMDNQLITDFLKSFCILDALTCFPISIEHSQILENSWKEPILLSQYSLLKLNLNIDYTNPILVDIIINGSSTHKNYLAEYIDNNWDKIISTIPSDRPSSFLTLISRYPWLPCQLTNRNSPPSRLFNKTNNVCSFLGPFSSTLISSYQFINKNLISFVKIRSEITDNDIICIFKHWSSAVFSSSLQHLISVYLNLLKRIKRGSLLISLLDERKVPVIFVPSSPIPSDPSVLISGFFVSKTEVFINDPIFNGNFTCFPPLSLFYPCEILSFFSEYFDVEKEPPFSTYLFMFSSQFLSSSNQLDRNKVFEYASKLGLKCLNSEINLESLSAINICNISEIYDIVKKYIDCDKASLLNSCLKNYRFIPTQTESFVSPSIKYLYICDDVDLKEIFNILTEISFVDLPNDIYSQSFILPSTTLIGFIALLISCEIPLLSVSVGLIVNENDNENQDSAWKSFISISLPFIYSYIACKYLNYFNKLCNTGVWDKIQKIKYIEHCKGSFKTISELCQFKIETTISVLLIDGVSPVLHVPSCDSYGIERCEYTKLVLREFLKIFLRPNPSLTQEILTFVRDMINLSHKNQIYHVSSLGLNKNQFKKHLLNYSEKYKNSEVSPLFSSLNFKVSYKDTSIQEGCVTQVIQPRFEDISNNVSYVEGISEESFNNYDHQRTAYTDSVGRWGEAVVNQMLKIGSILPQSDKKIIKVEWMNEKNETRLPYDFAVRVQNGSFHEDFFIEVKASSNPKSTSFELSIFQLEFALQMKSHYFIYKVTPKASKNFIKDLKEDDCVIKVFGNVSNHLRKKSLKLLVVSN